MVQKRAFFKVVGPYVATFAVLVLTSLLVAVIYLTRLSLPWVAFLTGVLAAAILSMVSRASKAEWIISRREAKISSLQEKLAHEIRLRRTLEQMLADGKPTAAVQGEGEQPHIPETATAPSSAPLPAASALAISAPISNQANVAQDMFVESLYEEMTGQENAVAHILAAIEHNEFCLYCQRIAPLSMDARQGGHYELLIRLQEEEEGMMPPGAFFPLVEKHGLMPQLDRWVVQHIVEWIAAHPASLPAREHSTFFINLATASLSDGDFAQFILDQLRINKVPAQMLCFEITDIEISLLHDNVAAFSQRIRDNGCGIALCNFGRDNVLFKPLHELHTDFLKIDGGIILDLLRNPADLAQAAAIARVARSLNVKTVAELVESDACMTKLREIGVDYGQGFGISTPVPLNTLR